MKKLFTTAVLALLATSASASVPIRATLEDLARGADHILVGRVVEVDMVDERCRQLTNSAARTGPGLTNTIRLHIAVDQVVVTNARSVPKVLKVPLDPFMHYSLGQIQKAHREPSQPALILLTGARFQPVLPGAFSRTLAEKDEAVRIYRKSHPRNPARPGAPSARRDSARPKPVVCD